MTALWAALVIVTAALVIVTVIVFPTLLPPRGWLPRKLGALGHRLIPSRLHGWMERRRYHLSLAEWDSRKRIGMVLHHSENLAGSDGAAEEGDFPAWLAEMEADGISAMEICNDDRRERGWGTP